MKVRCFSCATEFRLDGSLVPPEGAWVRCSRCGEVFLALPETAPKAEAPAASPEKPSDLGRIPRSPGPTPAKLNLSLRGRAEELARQRADFGLAQMTRAAGKPPRGKLFKIVFWLQGLVLLVALTALGSVVVMSHLGVGREVVEQAARLPGLALLLGHPSAGEAQEAPADAVRFSLSEVKSFNRTNNAGGRIFVIQGKVVSHHSEARSAVAVQGTLRDATGKVVARATSYAGDVLSSEELLSLGPQAVKSRLSSPLSPEGKPYVVAPGESLPFMIVLSDLPQAPLEYTAAVTGSQPAQGKPVRP